MTIPTESKGRPDRREGKKVSGGHFFSPWEIPWLFGCSPEDCGRKVITGFLPAPTGDDSFLIIDSRTGHAPACFLGQSEFLQIPQYSSQHACIQHSIKSHSSQQHSILLCSPLPGQSLPKLPGINSVPVTSTIIRHTPHCISSVNII